MTAAAVAGVRHASTLVVAELSAAKGTLNASTLSTITAAGQFKGPITVLVAGGQGMDAVAKQAAQVAGVSKVLVAEHAAYEKGLAENVCQAIVAAHKAGGYSHILAPSSMLVAISSHPPPPFTHKHNTTTQHHADRQEEGDAGPAEAVQEEGVGVRRCGCRLPSIPKLFLPPHG
jgi:hypothetical protein